MGIDIQGGERAKALRARSVRLLGAALEPIRLAPVRAKITFFDDNGPRGGLGMRCAVDVRLPFRPSIRVEQVAETSRIAFDGAFAALERRLERYRQRDRDIKRRPKKYFVAKRLLTGGLEPSAKPKRVRRRKEA